MCCEHQKHIVMVNVEADALAGPLLARRAAEAGIVYSLAYGDQPALICEMVDWARAAGFEVVAAGKGTKYLPQYHTSTPDTVWGHYGFSKETVAGGDFNAQMFNSFLDGTKSAIEMAAVANATGLTPAPGGLEFPPCGVDDLARLLKPKTDGGRLHHRGQAVRIFLPAGSVQLTAAARDAEGVAVLRPALVWESSAARIASISTNGRVTAEAAGMAMAIVHADAIADTTYVLVEAPFSPNAPRITGSLPVIALPGQRLVVNGERFAASPSENTVRLDGIAIPVVAASAQQITLALPPASQFACVSTGPVTLQVSTPLGIGVGLVQLQVAPQRTLALGQSIVSTGGLESRCVELLAPEGRYLITLQNGARSLGVGTKAFTLGGSGGPASGAALASVASSPTLTSYAALTAGAPRTSAFERTARRARAHAELLGKNIEMGRVNESTSRTRTPALARSAALELPAVGTIHPIRVPNLDAANICGSFFAIRARAVVVTPRLIILEDTASVVDGKPTLYRTMDDLYTAIGAEFDNIVWPVLQTFGNPLVMDSRLDGNGRVVLVFTPRMNQLLGGALLAATTTCDLRQPIVHPASNVGEFVYAQVPTSAAAGSARGTRARWMSEIRGTIAHEMKHVVSYTERIVRNLPLEEDWLEEATARHAEELFARAIYGTAQLANRGYEASLTCEVHISDLISRCPGKPRAMLPHFEALWDFLDASTARSPLGPTTTNDVSYYGSAWALTRWALDHSGIPEQAFFQALTLSGATGIANLEARSNRAWADMISEWSLAMVADDIEGVSPEMPRQTFRSWNLRSIYQGLCADLGPCLDPLTVPVIYPRPYPVQPIAARPGAFTLEFPSVVAGGFAVVDLKGGGAAVPRQLIALRGYRGAPLPADARFSILRVQ